MAYLVMMAARLIELHRVLKPTGSLYLHCDPTASHYLKMILDMIFGTKNFINEIVWQRYNRPKGSQFEARRFGNSTDTILFYGKTEIYNFYLSRIKTALDEVEIEKRYNLIDEKGVYYSGPLLRSAAMGTRPNLVYEYKDFTPGPEGWRMTKDKLAVLDAQGDVFWTKSGIPRRKVRPQAEPSTILDNLWFDIEAIGAQAAERLGYPTQKPIALLERIIQASSNPGDVILDPFCGCGTAVHAAQKLGRIWVGIDITPLATALIKSRLYDAFKIEAKKDYDLIGEPTTLSDAKHLANQDRYQFQWWALGLIPARPYGGQAGSKTGKKGADKGIDGVMTFSDSTNDTDKRIIIQVKSGKVKSSDIRDLNGTVDREKNAVMGIFITLEPPSRNMELEAMEIGYYHSEGFNRDYPKIQILTIEQLLAGEKVKFPGTDTTLKQAQREYIEVKQRDLL